MLQYFAKNYFSLAIASTVIMFTVYVVVQQNLRLSLNDSLVQIAEDGASTLASGYAPYVITGQNHVDMVKSLANFVIIYDSSGKVSASSGYIDEKIPIIPSGVLDYVKTHADDRLTWQPDPSIRVAVVVKEYSGKNSGFIVAGRSLREVENRINYMGLILVAAWVSLIIITFLTTLYFAVLEKKSID